jgi:hypothetical protein
VGADAAVHEAAGGKEGDVKVVIVIGILVVMGVFAVGGFLLNHERKRRQRTPKVHSRWPWGLGI